MLHGLVRVHARDARRCCVAGPGQWRGSWLLVRPRVHLFGRECAKQDIGLWVVSGALGHVGAGPVGRGGGVLLLHVGGRGQDVLLLLCVIRRGQGVLLQHVVRWGQDVLLLHVVRWGQGVLLLHIMRLVLI